MKRLFVSDNILCTGLDAFIYCIDLFGLWLTLLCLVAVLHNGRMLTCLLTLQTTQVTSILISNTARKLFLLGLHLQLMRSI